MIRKKNFDLVWKFSNLSLRSNYRIIHYNRFYSVDSKNTPSSETVTNSTIPAPPKRSSNMFALFVRDYFKRISSNLTVKQKFVMAGQEWKQLSPEQKEHYQKIGNEEFVKYKTAMNNFLESLSEEEMIKYQQIKKKEKKNKNRLRIKSKLRELNYPRKNISSYLFFLQDNMKKNYPDGNYPSVRTPEHVNMIKNLSQKWHQMTFDQRQSYIEMAKNDRKRYIEEVEQWKHELAKPENEEKLKELEKLSEKMTVNLSKKDKLKEKNQENAAIITKKRLQKKTATIKTKKKNKLESN